MAADTRHRLLADDGRELLGDLRFARSFRTRTKGLLGRTSLEPGEGLGFRERSIHMFFMRMPLDIVFCDGDLRVVRIARELRPWRMAGSRQARYVFEIGPGKAAGLGIEEGDRLQVEPPL